MPRAPQRLPMRCGRSSANIARCVTTFKNVSCRVTNIMEKALLQLIASLADLSREVNPLKCEVYSQNGKVPRVAILNNRCRYRLLCVYPELQDWPKNFQARPAKKNSHRPAPPPKQKYLNFSFDASRFFSCISACTTLWVSQRTLIKAELLFLFVLRVSGYICVSRGTLLTLLP